MNNLRDKIRIILQRTIWIILVSALAVSCTKDDLLGEGIPTGPDTEQETLVRFTVRTPAVVEPRLLSNKSVDVENAISEIQVLVFKDGRFQYRSEGINPVTNGNVTTFDVVLLTSSNEVVFYLVANANHAIENNAPLFGDSENTVKSKLNTVFTGMEIFERFPMFGIHSLPYLDAAGVNNLSITMLRSMAKVDLDATRVIDDFRLESIMAFRGNDLIQVIPNNITRAPSVNAPSVPGNASASVQTEIIPVPEGNLSFSQLYIPESAAPVESERTAKATCIVVGGSYQGRPVSYYRLDFKASDNSRPFGEILRNTRYVFNVTRVSANGWPTPEEAANNRSTGVVAIVKDWDAVTTDMVFDGENHFGVSARMVPLGHRAGEKFVLQVDTDLEDYQLQWADDVNGDPDPESTPSDISIANADFQAVKSADGSEITFEALTGNPLQGQRIQNLVIHAKRWIIKIRIVQDNPYKYSHIYINVLSVQEVGNLGYNAYTGLGDANATGLRGILNANFTPSGNVKIAGFNFVRVVKDDVMNDRATVSPAAMSAMDILFFTNDNKTSKNVSSWALSWLEASPNRVLIVAADWTGTNVNLFSAINDPEHQVTWTHSTDGGNFNFVGRTEDNQPFTAGPFGEVSENSIYGRVDDYAGRSVNYSSDIIPLLTSSRDGGMVVGVNKKRRIIYWGDCSMLEARSGNYINNTSGNVNNDQSRLVANLWAWIVEDVILPGKTVN